MGLISPLYLVGLAALSLPIIFHLVRRTPKGRQEFSSLMFLNPTPPILTRRSRLDQVLLLLLRLAALALLAAAFARPFLRESATLPFDALPGRRLAIVLDSSASMKRGDLWPQAIRTIEKQLDDLGPEDEVSLYTFGDRCRRIVGPSDLEASAGTNNAAVVKSRLKELQPDWTAGDLGNALVTIAGELDASTDVAKSAADPEILIVTDAQQGNRVDALQAFEWPSRVRVELLPVAVKQSTNAQLQLLESPDDAPDAQPRVRVASASNSTSDEFHVRWDAPGFPQGESQAAVYVPPGQSRVVKLPRPEGQLTADRLVLSGDEHEFDNTFYVAPPRKEQVSLLYFGDEDAQDANGQRHYLALATGGDPLREVTIKSPPISDDLADRDARLAVLSGGIPEDLRTGVKTFLENGGILFCAPTTPEAARQATDWLEGVSLSGDGQSTPRIGDRFSLLGQIDFTYPLFSPFANPRYSDFTKVHFWTHWPLQIDSEDGLHVAARFDSGQPAVVERRLGKGRVILLAASWRPDDSQLALSSKFVPLVGSLLDLAYGSAGNLTGVTVNQPIALPEWRGTRASAVILPDSRRIQLPADANEFRETSQPGIYRAVYGVEELPCAVNLAATESNTALMDVAQLEQLGLRLGAEKTRVERAEAIRQQRDTELEARQKLWRWGIMALLSVLILETWWAGRRSQAPHPAVEVAT